MSTLTEAIEVLRRAELGMGAIMERALAEQRYLDVASAASLAESLSKLIKDVSSDRSQMPGLVNTVATAAPQVPSAALQADSGVASAKKYGGGSDEYPRFKRDEEKLVKVAWSKKDRREYEHRAPHEVVSVVAASILSVGRPGKVFSMEDLMPFKTSAGAEIPSYQAYLALAWFRSLGLVEQRGKNGYAAVVGALDILAIERAWNALPCQK